MLNTIFRIPAVLGLAFLMVSWTPMNSTEGFADADYSRMNWRSFQTLPTVQQTIDLKNPDHALLNAAVFYVSNQAREKYNLPLFTFEKALRNMASFHAGQMARYHFVNHNNPRAPRFATVEARGRQFEARVNAENVASSFLHFYRSGTRYYTKKSIEGDLFFDARSNRPLTIHTYWSFAEDLVQGWLDSPPHRHNLLHTQLKTLGCACEVGKDEVNSGELPLAYCTQNFGL